MYSLGLSELCFEDESRTFENRPRSLEVAVWYPTDNSVAPEKIEFGIWKIKEAAREAPILVNGKKLPLILFSHGYSANQWVCSWFAEYLAVQGFIVACVKHYGNTFHNMIPEICVRPWNRPQDLSVVLDNLLVHPKFKDAIDQNKIAAAGFSQGGVTTFWLGGAQANLHPEKLKEQITLIHHPAYRNLHFRSVSTERLDSILDNFTEQDFINANQSYRDERIKAIFAMAPGIDQRNKIFTKEGLSKVLVPSYITIGESDTNLVEDAKFFAESMPNSTFTLIPGKVTHATLLNEGIPAAKKTNADYVCDHPSINRAKIHEEVSSYALDFFNLQM